MKIQVKISLNEQKRINNPQKIVEIDINNGNWKYWDDMMETDKKQTMTINTINKATYLQMPVKDAIGHYDIEKYRETRELEMIDASVRDYDTLLSYITYRIDNLKEDYKKWGDKTQTTTCVLFEDVYVKSYENTVVRNMEYTKQGLATVEMEVIE